ncbi:MAG: Hypothetical protein BHV28_01580 [Candidatus Tokpelaia hoelldobleri]|uniref:Uncharacterized protein n=1 Tax=Candidatus Tokpelaia hoelldobleri TaxID=1902579 RepID=A0A1U9JSQ2_9HYPH|nr:MAG: Hypothetical protein BHV28_01580 [Candidatus Tokpelaia hoelldoblerii]
MLQHNFVQRFGLFCVLPAFLLPGGCQTTATAWTKKISLHKTTLPTECSGWEKMLIKSRTRYDLARYDPQLLMNIDAHNLRGRNLGCWK